MKIAALTDLQFEAFLTNFAGKIDNYSPVYDISVTDVANVKADSKFFTYVMDVQNSIKSHSKDWTSYKNILRSSAKAVNLGNPPLWMIPESPNATPADITGRISKLVLRMQGHVNHTEAIGNDLGINAFSAAATAAELADMKPILKIHLVAGQPIIEWKKGDADGIEIHSKVDDGDYQFLATDLHPHFQDKTSLPPHGQSVVRKYKAIYILGDDKIGQWSDEVSISIMG